MQASLTLWVKVICFALFLFLGRVCSDRGSDLSVSNSAIIDSQGNVVARTGPSEVGRHPRFNRGMERSPTVRPRRGEQHRSMPPNHLRPEMPEVRVEHPSPQQSEQQPPPRSLAGLGSSALQEVQDQMPGTSWPSFNFNFADLKAAFTWDAWSPTSPDSFWRRGSGNDAEQKCWSHRGSYNFEQIVHGWKNEYRIAGPSLGAIDGKFFVSDNEDCQNKTEKGNFTLEVTKYANSSDLVNNSAFILGVEADENWDQKSTIHICAPQVGEEVPTCLAKIGKTENQLVYSVKAFLGEDWPLWILASACLFCGLLLVISSIHAVVLLITMPVPILEERLKGVQRTGIIMMIGNTILKGTMVVFGVDHMSTAVISSSLAESSTFVVDGVFYSGLVLSFLGILRLAGILYYSQIYEVGLRNGKCVLPRESAFSGDISGQHISLSFLDIVVFMALGTFACLNLKAVKDSVGKVEVEVETAYQEFLFSGIGCWQSFPSLLSSIVSNVVKQTVIDQGVCPTQLPALSIEYAEDTTSTILKHVTKHPKVKLGMGRFCETCRQGRDPLVVLDVDGEDPSDLPDGSELLISDIRWHARYIHSKTASRATVCSLPVILALMLTALVRSVATRYFYVNAIPTLEHAMPSEGQLFPPFDPRITDYTLYYPQHVSSVAFLNKGDNLLAEQREFTYVGNRSEWEPAQNYSMYPVPFYGEEAVPFNLSIRVRGGSGASLTGGDMFTNYSITMTRVERLVVTAKFVATTGNWSACCYLHLPFPEHHLTVPASVEGITIEVSVLLHVWGVPMSLEAWREAMQKPSSRNTDSYFRTTGVFLPDPNATKDSCSQDCFSEKARTFRCIFSKPAHGGCYLIMIPTSPKSSDSCEKLHEAGTDRSVVASTINPAIQKVLDETERKMNFCEGDLLSCSHWTVGPNKALTADLSGRLFSPVTLNLSGRIHNVFTASWSSRSREQPLPQPIFSQKYHIWKASNDLDDIIVVPQKGLKATKSGGRGQPFSVRLQQYEVARTPKPIRLLIVARVKDWSFRIQFPKDGVEAVSQENMDLFDLEGACRRLKWADRALFPACSRPDYWNNTGYEWQAVTIVKLDPVFPTRTLVGKIERRNDYNTHLKESSFTLEFQAAEDVSLWALQRNQTGQEGHCKVSLPERTPEEAYMLLTQSIPAITEAISSCSKNITVEMKEVSASFSPSGYFLWIMRNTMTTHWTVHLLDAVLAANKDVIARALRFESEGIFATEPESIPPSFKRLWEAEYKLDWATILLYTKDIERLLCSPNIGPEVKINPRHFAYGMRGLDTGERRLSRLRSIKNNCTRMHHPPVQASGASEEERAWTLASTSPIAMAISQNDHETLEALLDKYGGNYTRLTMADDVELGGNQYKLTYMDLVITDRCYACVDSVQRMVERMAESCQGDRTTSDSAGVHETKRCAKFRRDHTRLTFGPWSFKSRKTVLDMTPIIRNFSEKVNIRSVWMSHSMVSNERLADFQPMWQFWRQLKKLHIEDNNISLCDAQSECSWLPIENKQVQAPLDIQESYPSFEEAKKACDENREAGCERISCNSTGECTPFFLEHDNDYPEVDSPGSRIYRPSSACREERLFSFLSLLLNLKTLGISNNRLCNRGISQIVRALPAESTLTNVSLQNVGMTADDLTVLSEFGKKTKKTKKLEISENVLGAKGFLALLGSDSITRLNASSIELDWKADREGFENLVERLSQLADIEHLDLSHNALGDEGLQALQPAFKKWPKLKYLNLCNTSLTWQFVGQLRWWTKSAKGFQELYLGENDLADLKTEDVGLLFFHPTLRLLDLHKSGLGSRLAKDLIKYMWNDTRANIDRLDLWDNDLPLPFLEWIATKRLVSRLGLGGNRWEEGRPKERSELAGDVIALYKETSVAGTLDMSVVNSRCWQRFAENASFPFQLERLWLDHVKFTNNTLQDQFSFFRMLPNLEVLKIRWNDFPTDILRGLLSAASALPNLREFAITGNNFSLQDWPFWDNVFPKLKILTGDFNSTDMMFLRHWLPYTVIRT